LAIDGIFLLIQCPLFLLGNVPTILAGHETFLLANLMVFLKELGGLALGNFTFLHFLIDSPILVFQAIIHLVTTRMVLRPMALAGHGSTVSQCGQ
jgi:hypothetical protein